MKSKKKVFGVDISNVETYTRYSGVADEIKKFLEGDCLFKLFKGTDLKKKGKRWFRSTCAF